MWCWSGGRGILKKTVSVLEYCVLLSWCTKVWAVLTGWSTVSGFDLAWFSSVFRAPLCLRSSWCYSVYIFSVFIPFRVFLAGFTCCMMSLYTSLCNVCMYEKFLCLHPFLYLLVSWAWWDWPLVWLTNHRPSVLWHCWLGHLTHNSLLRNNL